MSEKEKKPRKRKGNRAELIDPIDTDKIGVIESTSIELEQLTLKGKRWKVNLKIGTILPKSYHRYTVKLDLDEEPYLSRIDDLHKALSESLFAKEKISKKETRKQIRSINEELEEMRQKCEHIEFSAVVEEVKYRDGDTLLAARIPDDVIEALNRQKYNFEAYKIALHPIFS